jgi:serine/threonine protein kinase/Flp pilus assembly protein TadD
MNATVSLHWQEAQSQAAGGPEARAALRQLAAEMHRLWAQGEPLDTHTLLARHPDLAVDRWVLAHLALEEYRLRADAGLAPDPHEFSSRFPECENSVLALVRFQEFVDERASWLATLPEDGLAEDPPAPADQSADDWPVPGDELLGFRLLEELGRGTFARVFLAAEPDLGDRLVAVKVSRRGAGEAHTLGRLKHPHIVPVHSVRRDPTAGWTVVCMPYLGRTTLEQVVRRVRAEGNLPPFSPNTLRDALSDLAAESHSPITGAGLLHGGSYIDGILALCIPVAEALAYVHGLGIAHGDLKPSNILLSTDGQPLLLDFNLAAGQRVGEAMLGGTLPYAAPEQLRAFTRDPDLAVAPPDARSDLFALGALLYELLSGQLPFGPSPAGLTQEQAAVFLLLQQRKQARPLCEVNPGVSAELSALVERCLAFDPEARPPSAAFVAAALRRQLAPARPERKGRLVPRLALVVAVLVACVAAAGAFCLSDRPATRTDHRQQGLAAYRQRAFAEALPHLQRALDDDPNNADLLFARARTQQQLGKLESALADYDKADGLRRDGRIKACLGYCWNVKRAHGSASVYYQQAIDAGFTTAEVCNNLGFSYLQGIGRLQDAQAMLDRALALNPGLQAAHHNRACLELRRCLECPTAPLRTALEHIELARALGPPHPQLCVDAALLYALAAESEPAWIEPGLTCLKQALECGLSRQALLREDKLNRLTRHPAFQQYASRPAPAAPPVPTNRVVDPLRDVP